MRWQVNILLSFGTKLFFQETRVDLFISRLGLESSLDRLNQKSSWVIEIFWFFASSAVILYNIFFLCLINIHHRV